MFGNALDSMISQSGQNRGSASNAPTPTSPPPTSFFSAASPITAGGVSRGASPFGTLTPDLSKATPEQLKFIVDSLSNLTYSVPLGGYITRDQANDSNSAFNRGYYNKTVLPPSGAQNAAKSVFDLIGSFPTRPIGTQALNALPGYSPRSGPSFNTQLGGSYGGPWATQGWP